MTKIIFNSNYFEAIYKFFLRDTKKYKENFQEDNYKI